jgi:hypothetical protein
MGHFGIGRPLADPPPNHHLPVYVTVAEAFLTRENLRQSPLSRVIKFPCQVLSPSFRYPGRQERLLYQGVIGLLRCCGPPMDKPIDLLHPPVDDGEKQVESRHSAVAESVSDPAIELRA